MQSQKDGATQVKSDVFLVFKAVANRIVAEIRHLAMRFLQHGHDQPPIASHLQHGYLSSIKGE
jgi:hypothetical protein